MYYLGLSHLKSHRPRGEGNFENTRKITRHYTRTAELHTEHYIQYYTLHSEKNLPSPPYTILNGIALILSAVKRHATVNQFFFGHPEGVPTLNVAQHFYYQ